MKKSFQFGESDSGAVMRKSAQRERRVQSERYQFNRKNSFISLERELHADRRQQLFEVQSRSNKISIKKEKHFESYKLIFYIYLLCNEAYFM